MSKYIRGFQAFLLAGLAGAVLAGCTHDRAAEIGEEFPGMVGSEARRVVFYSEDGGRRSTRMIEEISLPGNLKCYVPFHKVHSEILVGTMVCVQGGADGALIPGTGILESGIEIIK